MTKPDESKTIPVSPKKPRRWLRRVLWGVSSLLGIAFVLLLSVRAYIFSWTWAEPPECHASWSESQRADLLALDEELRHNKSLAAVPALYWTEEMSHPLVPVLNEHLGNGNIVSIVLNYKEFAAPARRALHKAMISGKGDVLTQQGEPLAIWALRLEMPGLFRELVKRGADVNREYETLMPTVSSSTRTLAIEALASEFIREYGKAGKQELTPAAHRQLLEWLSSCQPDLGRPHLQQSVADAVLFAIIAGTTDAAQWALRHGFRPTPASRHMICCLLCKENQPEALRQLLSEPAFGVETSFPDQFSSTLQFLLTLDDISMREMTKLASLLLESGSDPNFLPQPHGPGEEPTLQKTALLLALEQLATLVQKERADALALIRLLVEHGARLRPGETLPENLPADSHPTLRELRLMD